MRRVITTCFALGGAQAFSPSTQHCRGGSTRGSLVLRGVFRRQALGEALSGAVAFAITAATGGAAAEAATGASDTERNRLKVELGAALRQPSPPPVASGSAREAAVNALLDQLEGLRDPTNEEGAGFGAMATGSWRVAFAPHIAKLSGLAGAAFDPILYELDARTGGIESHVQYNAPFRAKGWLSTRGGYGQRPKDDGSSASVAFVEWAEAWWNPGSADAPSAGPAGGAFAPVVSAIAQRGFVPAFANFPVTYLDRDVCVFVFPLSNTRIVAVKQGGALDPWRP